MADPHTEQETAAHSSLFQKLIRINLTRYVPVWTAVFLVLATLTALLIDVGADVLFAEKGLLTFFSPILLMLCSITSGIVFWERTRYMKSYTQKICSSQFIWALVSIGFAFLAADEITNFHSSFGLWLRAYFEQRGTPISPRFDDTLIWAYLAVAFLLVCAYSDELLVFRHEIKYTLYGMLCILLSVALNMFAPRQSLVQAFTSEEGMHVMRLLSDAMKIQATAFFLSTLISIRAYAAKIT